MMEKKDSDDDLPTGPLNLIDMIECMEEPESLVEKLGLKTQKKLKKQKALKAKMGPKKKT